MEKSDNEEAIVYDFEKHIVGKNENSIYTLCLNCGTWGINVPLNKKCGDCGHVEGITYYDAKTIDNYLMSLQSAVKKGNSKTIKITKPVSDNKYSIANDGNCSNKTGHSFGLVEISKSKEIRKEHPKMKYALWECTYCHKITQST